MKSISYSVLLPLFLVLVSSKVSSEPELYVLATKGDFSHRMINKISENLRVKIHVTYAENRFEKHDKLIRNNGIDYDIIYDSGKYLKGLMASNWIEPVSVLEETGKIKLWKSGVFGILKKKSAPKLKWQELFNYCKEIKGRVQLTDSGTTNAMIASESLNPSIDTLIEIRDGYFKNCRFSILPRSKSKQLDQIVHGDISYAVIDNEYAQSLLSVSNKIDFYVPDGQKFGWSKRWIVLKKSNNVEIAKMFLEKVSKKEIKEIEAKLRYSSFPGFSYDSKSLLSLANSYSDEIQMKVSDIEKSRLYQEIQSEIVENSGDK